MLGCVNDNYGIDKEKYMNNDCSGDNSFAVKNSDLFMFFMGLVMNKIFDFRDLIISYLTKDDKLYNKLYISLHEKIKENTTVNTKIFNNDDARNSFAKKVTHIIVDCIEPDYKIRPTAEDTILKLYKCLQKYMIQDEVDKYINLYKDHISII